VATSALLLSMLAFQVKAGLDAMVKALSVERDECDLKAAMLRMTTGAISGDAFICARMKSFAGVYPAPDFHMAVEAFEAASR
jgi:hypothetical protein